MEKVLPQKLTRERKIIQGWKKKSDEERKPFYRYRSHVKNLLYLKSFGKNVRRTAFKRMALYPKLIYIWHWLMTLSVINCCSWYLLTDTHLNYMEVASISIVVGLIPALVIFNFGRTIISGLLVGDAKFCIREKGNAGFYHELLHQFDGVYNGYFDELEWNDSRKSKLSGLDGSAPTKAFIKSNYFKGGSSAGTWS